MALALAAPAVACRQPPPEVTRPPLADPAPDSVELVLYLIGDAGEALPGTSPVVAHLGREIEAWSGALGRDSAVHVLFLGDNVYPVGVRDRTDPEYEADTLRMHAQLDVVAGPNARRNRAGGWFLPGNHDWGNLIGEAGLQRLTNMQEHIDAAREAGLNVRMIPTAGAPGPEVLDLGNHLRLLALDTHWWLQEPRGGAQADVLAGVEEALRTAGTRSVVIAAHHPFESGGSHGGTVSIWERLGVLWLLRRTGSLVQDLNSNVYRDLLDGLHEVFRRTRPPLVFAGGHDHSLQVIEDDVEDEPEWLLVSGAGSKSTEVAYIDGMRYADDVGGYMRLSFLGSGSVLLHVIATTEEHLHCAGATDAEVAACIEEGVASFRTVYSVRLR